MFLDRFNNTEKEMFLDLAVYASQCNGVVEESEKDLLIQYCKEMDIPFYDVSSIHSMDEVVACFSKATKSKKKIAIFELIGLCACDGEIDSVEDAFARKFASDIGVDLEVYNQLLEDIDEYSMILSIITKHLM